MNADELSQSAQQAPHPPDDLSQTLRALWFARAGRWHEAHDLCQYIPDPDGAWIHAHLHRIENDSENASYWYYRAERSIPHPSLTIEQEWFTITRHFASAKVPR